jgi:tetratricopeptide (TPR) repeat protein
MISRINVYRFLTKLLVLFLVLGLGNLYLIGQTEINKKDSIFALCNNPSEPPVNRFNALYRLIWDTYLFNKPDSALIFSENLVELAEKYALKNELGKVHNLRGIAFALLGDTKSALLNYEKTLEIRKELNDTKGLSSVLSNIGTIYSDNGMYRKALDYFNRSLEIKEDLKDVSGIISAHNNLGNVYQRTGELDQALHHFLLARENIEKMGNSKMKAQSALNIANVYFSKGLFAQAYHYYMISFNYFKTVGENKGLANVTNNLGLLYSRLSNYEKSIEFYTQSFALYEEMNYLPGMALASINIANLEKKLGHLFQAQTKYKEALDLYLETENYDGQVTAHYDLGALFLDKNELEEALNHFEMCINLEKKLARPSGVVEAKAHYGYTLTLQGKISLGLVILLEAYQEAQQNKWVGKRKLLADYLFKVYQSKEPEKANTYLFQKLETTYEDLKTNYFNMSEYEKELYFTRIYRDYNDLIAFTINNGHKYPYLKDSTLNTVLMIKGLSLKSSTLLRNSIYGSDDAQLIHDFETWIELKKNNVKAREKGEIPDSLENQVMLAEQSLIQRSTALKNYYHSFSQQWKNLQKRLSDKEALVEFIQYEDVATHSMYYGAIVIKKRSKSPDIIKLCAESELTTYLSDFRGNNLNYVKNLYGTIQQPKNEVYELIWKPLTKTLVGTNVIYYSPVGLLHKVSFAALSEVRGNLLIDKVTLRQVTNSFEALQKNSTSLVTGLNNLMLVGGVEYSASPEVDEVWKYLPATLTETQKILEILSLNTEKPMVLVGKEAQESIIKSTVPNMDLFI